MKVTSANSASWVNAQVRPFADILEKKSACTYSKSSHPLLRNIKKKKYRKILMNIIINCNSSISNSNNFN